MNERMPIIEAFPFRVQIAVSDCHRKLRKHYKKLGTPKPDVDRNINGCAGWESDKNGVRYWFLYVAPDSRNGTVIHECSHLVDFIFEKCGVPPGTESTEVRAYLHQDLVEQAMIALGRS